jgi:hypothetical protein
MACEEKKRLANAWLLDPEDHLAARLARDGDPEDTHFEETDTRPPSAGRVNARINTATLSTHRPRFQRMSLQRLRLDVKVTLRPHTARDCTDLGGRQAYAFIRKPYQRCHSAALAGGINPSAPKECGFEHKPVLIDAHTAVADVN